MQFTIIVPIYNAEKYLKKCLESLIEKTEISYEVILINDGSKDSSAEICKEYKKKHPKIFKYVENENFGCSYSRNLGIKLAKGKYLGFIDSDDYVDKKYFLDLYKQAKDRNLDIIIGSTKVINEENFILSSNSPCKIKSKEDFLKNLKFFNSPWNKLYKKEILLKNKVLFPENSHMGEDMAFVYKVAMSSLKIAGIDNGLYYNYLENQQGVTYNLNKRWDIYKSFQDILDNTKEFDKKLFNELFIKNAIVLPMMFINQFKNSDEQFMSLKKEVSKFKKFFSLKTKLIFMAISILGKNKSNRIVKYILNRKIGRV